MIDFDRQRIKEIMNLHYNCVSQIFYLGPIFKFMVKNGKPFVILFSTNFYNYKMRTRT